MTIIEFQYSWDSESEKKISDNCIPNAVIIPETAIIRRGIPFFIPGWGTDWQAKIYIGTKITKLGKSIPSRFACRYKGESFLGVQFFDNGAGIKTTAQRVLFGFDNSLMISQTVDFTKPIEIKTGTIGHNAKLIKSRKEIIIQDNGPLMDLCIANASQFFTLHTGDIILGGFIKQELFKVEQETRVIFSQDSNIILDHKIK